MNGFPERRLSEIRHGKRKEGGMAESVLSPVSVLWTATMQKHVSGVCFALVVTFPRHFPPFVMSNVLEYLPELEGEEQVYVARIVNEMPEEQAQQFSRIYRHRRQEPQVILLAALAGFIFVAGVHRFIVDEVGMGLLYLFTAGLCFIGTLVDVINYRSIALRYNRRQADEVATLVA